MPPPPFRSAFSLPCWFPDSLFVLEDGSFLAGTFSVCFSTFLYLFLLCVRFFFLDFFSNEGTTFPLHPRVCVPSSSTVSPRRFSSFPHFSTCAKRTLFSSRQSLHRYRVHFFFVFGLFLVEWFLFFFSNFPECFIFSFTISLLSLRSRKQLSLPGRYGVLPFPSGLEFCDSTLLFLPPARFS